MFFDVSLFNSFSFVDVIVNYKHFVEIEFVLTVTLRFKQQIYIISIVFILIVSMIDNRTNIFSLVPRKTIVFIIFLPEVEELLKTHLWLTF